MHSNSALPLHYRVSGVWGGHEGSFLLWCLMLGVWMLAWPGHAEARANLLADRLESTPSGR